VRDGAAVVQDGRCDPISWAQLVGDRIAPRGAAGTSGVARLGGPGVGRDYHDVPPLKGIYSGGGSTALDLVVEITRLA